MALHKEVIKTSHSVIPGLFCFFPRYASSYKEELNFSNESFLSHKFTNENSRLTSRPKSLEVLTLSLTSL